MPWMRDVSSDRARATARASSVLPVPGTSSTRTWPSARSAIATRRTVSSAPTTARPTATRRSDHSRRPATATSSRSADAASGPPAVHPRPARRRRSRTRCRPCAAAPPSGAASSLSRKPTRRGRFGFARDPVAKAAIDPYRRSSQTVTADRGARVPAVARPHPRAPRPDPRPRPRRTAPTRAAGKINLSSGVFVDETGTTPVLPTVIEAERRLADAAGTKLYRPIDGEPAYRELVRALVLGADHEAVTSGRALATQTPGGTGGLRVAADLLRQTGASQTLWMSEPTWPNHPQLFHAAGFRIRSYPYTDATGRRIDEDGDARRAGRRGAGRRRAAPRRVPQPDRGGPVARPVAPDRRPRRGAACPAAGRPRLPGLRRRPARGRRRAAGDRRDRASSCSSRRRSRRRSRCTPSGSGRCW